MRCPSCGRFVVVEKETGPGEALAVGAFCEHCERFMCAYCFRWFGMWQQGGTDTIACDGCWCELRQAVA
jgi:hypothetical protein